MSQRAPRYFRGGAQSGWMTMGACSGGAGRRAISASTPRMQVMCDVHRSPGSRPSARATRCIPARLTIPLQAAIFQLARFEE